MTAGPSDAAAPDAVAPDAGAAEAADPLAELAEQVAAAVGGRAEISRGTAKIRVDASAWKESITAARDRFGLVFLSWLSAVDWSNEPAVGDPPDPPVEERFEMLCAVSDLDQGRLVLISADIDRGAPSIDSLCGVYPGANWHEREAAEMFGIDFAGHPDLDKLYLPDGFEGHPLRKSYPLLSREVKPWPGKVDVEEMPEDDSGPAAGNGAAPSTMNPGA